MKSDEQKLIPFPLDHDENAGALPEVSPDPELNTALRSWKSAVPSAELDARVLESYREWTETLSNRARLHRWISRGLLGVAVAAGILAAVWTIADRQPLAAMELLDESRRADAKLLAELSLVLHRICAYEERRMPDGAVLERRRIESWHRGSTAVRARRVFAAAGQMVAGEWIDPNGSRWTYSAPNRATPVVRREPSLADSAGLASIDPGLMEPSAESFLALLPALAVEQLTTTELGSDRIVVAYRSDDRDAGLEAAQVVLRKPDYRAIEQSVRVRQNGESREFYVAEVSFESVPAATVSNSVFEPDIPDMLGGAPIDTRAAREPARMTDEELLGLEVTLLDRLDRAEALVGQEASVTRQADGRLEVKALVEGEERKKVLLDAVEGLSRSPAVDLDIQTFAEAASRTPMRSNDRASVRDVVVSGQIAARDELVRSFLSKDDGTPGNTSTLLDEAVRRFANEALSRSREAVLHAGTARDLVTRFSAAQIASMDASARDRWRSLVIAHLRAVGRESALLRQLLEPVFLTAGGNETEPSDAPPGDVGLAAERLFRSAISHDEAVRAAFALSARTEAELEISRIEFLQSLRAVENLAREIANQL